ncbi:hypothetical protein AB0G54_21280 [Streptomyces yokosukanensis]
MSGRPGTGADLVAHARHARVALRRRATPERPLACPETVVPVAHPAAPRSPVNGRRSPGRVAIFGPIGGVAPGVFESPVPPPGPSAAAAAHRRDRADIRPRADEAVRTGPRARSSDRTEATPRARGGHARPRPGAAGISTCTCNIGNVSGTGTFGDRGPTAMGAEAGGPEPGAQPRPRADRAPASPVARAEANPPHPQAPWVHERGQDMSTYNFGNTGGPADFGDYGHIDMRNGTPDLETLMVLAGRLTDALRAEYPGIVGYGEIIQGALQQSADDGLPPNRGRIRIALENIAIAAGAGTGSLNFTRQLTHAFDL